MKASLWRQIMDPFERWLSLPNYDAVETVAATIVANRLPGEPLWLALVGPSSSGKTEIVRALETVRRVHQVDNFTTSTLSSGYKPGKSKKGERNGITAEYGLLAKMNDDEPHIITIGDFSTILQKRYDPRGEIMSQLRRLYDGVFDDPYGNGVTVHWRGKCGMIVCSTGIFDREMGAQSAFGDRFMVCRNLPGDPITVAEIAGQNAPSTERMRRELRLAMKKLDKVRLPTAAIKLSSDVRTLIAKLCAFVARSRSQVPRETRGHSIVAAPEIEGTGRMSGQLHQLLRGLMVFRGRKVAGEDEIELIERVAFGTIPSMRLDVIAEMPPAGITFEALSGATGLPRTPLYRTLEDMQMLDLISWRENPADRRKGIWYPYDDYKPFFYQINAGPRGS